MATRKPRGRKPKTQKSKDNVAYLCELTDDERFSSPTTVLGSYLDEYNTGKMTSQKLMVLILEDDGGYNFRINGMTPDEVVLIAAKLHRVGMDGFQATIEDDD
jgi:hypothetical protein